MTAASPGAHRPVEEGRRQPTPQEKRPLGGRGELSSLFCPVDEVTRADATDGSFAFTLHTCLPESRVALCRRPAAGLELVCCSCRAHPGRRREETQRGRQAEARGLAAAAALCCLPHRKQQRFAHTPPANHPPTLSQRTLLSSSFFFDTTYRSASRQAHLDSSEATLGRGSRAC